MPDLIRISEAAEEFNLHRVTLHRLIREGRLTAYKREIGRGTYVDRDELKRLRALRPFGEGEDKS